MDREEELKSIMQASFHYHELFKKTQVTTVPDTSVTKTQFEVLVALQLGGAQSMGTISERLNIASEQVTRAMSALREGGYVLTDRDPHNRRSHIARLAPKGQELLDAQLERSKAAARDYMGALTDDDWEKLARASRDARAVLRKLRKSADDY